MIVVQDVRLGKIDVDWLLRRQKTLDQISDEIQNGYVNGIRTEKTAKTTLKKQ